MTRGRGTAFRVSWGLLVQLRRRRWTIPELALELGVHERTVRRYLYLLREVGLPVQNVGSVKGPDRGLWMIGSTPEWPRGEASPIKELRA